MAGASPLPSLRLALAALAGAALAGGLAYAAVVLGSGHVDDRGTTAALGLLVGWSFTGAGLVAWWRRPANRVGPLMAAVGFAWFATGVSASDDDVVFTVGIALDALFVAFAVHLLLAFPTGELQSRLERLIVLAGYLIATVLQVPSLLFEARGEPRNLLIVSSDQDLSDLLDALQFALAVIPFGAAAVILVRRWRAATPPQRRAIAPVVTTGGLALLASGVANGLDAAGARQGWADVLEQLTLAAVPFGFLAGLLRSRITQAGAMSSLMARLGGDPGPDAVRAALAEALGDPSLRLAYWLPDGERFVDADGRPVRVDVGTWSEVERNGSRIAAIGHDPALADEPQLVRAAGPRPRLAIENQRLAAALRARIEELRASRARIVEAGDAERRRLERDLHDGAQSRLVALHLKLRLAQRRASEHPELAALIAEAGDELQASLDEVRELARGIHPAVLTDRGLDAALRSLAVRAPVPVEVVGGVPDDLPGPVATAAYFVVAEALTNVAKYASAAGATVAVARTDDRSCGGGRRRRRRRRRRGRRLRAARARRPRRRARRPHRGPQPAGRRYAPPGDFPLSRRAASSEPPAP